MNFGHYHTFTHYLLDKLTAGLITVLVLTSTLWEYGDLSFVSKVLFLLII